MKKTFILVGILFLATSVNLYAGIPKSAKAKSEYLLAENLLKKGKYGDAIVRLNNAKTLLNGTNSKIQYLLTKCYQNLKNYTQAKTELNKYFSVTPESMSETDQYNEMVILISELEYGPQKDKEEAQRRKIAQANRQRDYKMRLGDWKDRKSNYLYLLKESCRDNYGSGDAFEAYHSGTDPAWNDCMPHTSTASRNICFKKWDAKKERCFKDAENKAEEWVSRNPRPQL